MAEQEDFCRDYLRGNCSRGFKCRYKHPDAAEVAARAVSTGLDVGRTVFCRDFQKGMCTRENCKFVHATEAEELYYKLTGQMPPRLQSPNPPEVTPNTQLHQLMLNAYLTGDFTAYTHQLQVMGYTVAPVGGHGDAVGVHTIVPSYVHQQVGVPPSPGGLGSPVPGGMHPSGYSPIHSGFSPTYQMSYPRMPGSHVSMPPGASRPGAPRRQPYSPIMVSSGIQTPRLSTMPPFHSSSAQPSVSQTVRPPAAVEVQRQEFSSSVEERTPDEEGPLAPPPSAEKTAPRNSTSSSFASGKANLLEDLQMKVEELERRVTELQSDNDILREENAKLKGQS